jgi:hypothetical protein
VAPALPDILVAALDIFFGAGDTTGSAPGGKWGTDAIVEYADHGNRAMGRGGR